MTLQGGERRLVSVGSYRLTGKKLGKGNFARVEEAVHSILNIKVAIKVMDITTIKEEYVVKHLYREARIMSRLQHPCIAALFQTMQNGNLYYLVTEMVGGGDLCTFIKGQKSGKLEERLSRRYARQLTSAISHMHNLGIVHRDLKMENVMLDAFQTQIKIVDFGLSNEYDSNNLLRTHCGSPEYAAPELFVAGKSYGPEVDLWSLGVILYGMIVGQLPFVTAKDETVSNAERRKRLLIQINKGISSHHRKALSLCSMEFKLMIAKLLVVDSSRRVTINELSFHPWITDKGHKVIRLYPVKKFEDNHDTCIIKQVAQLLQMDCGDVRYALATDPQGNISGMYNILNYKYLQQKLEGDGVSRTVNQPTYTPAPKSVFNKADAAPLTDTPKGTEVKTNSRRQDFMKSAPPQRQDKGIPPTPRSMSSKVPVKVLRHTSTNPGGLQKNHTVNTNVPRKPSIKKGTLSSDLRNRLHISSEAHQNNNIRQCYMHQQQPPQMNNLKPIQQQNLSHTASSVPVTPTTSRSKRTTNELQVMGTRSVARALNIKGYNDKPPKANTKPGVNTPRSSGTRSAGSAIRDKARSKSEPLANSKLPKSAGHAAIDGQAKRRSCREPECARQNKRGRIAIDAASKKPPGGERKNFGKGLGETAAHSRKLK